MPDHIAELRHVRTTLFAYRHQQQRPRILKHGVTVMLAQRLILSLNAVLCATLVVIAGCDKKSTSSGESRSTPSNNEGQMPTDSAEVAKAKKESINNLKQLAIAMHNYHDSMGKLPEAGFVLDKKTTPNPQEAAFAALSWRVKLLPYIEAQAAYTQIMPQLQSNPFMAIPEKVANQSIRTYRNPLQNAKSPKTNYRVFVGRGSIFDPFAAVNFNGVSDGTSNTILIVEAAEPVDWTNPTDLPFDPDKPLPILGFFPGGFHAAMADGSVRWIPSDTLEATIKAMITRNGREVIDMPGKRVDVSEEDQSTDRRPTSTNESSAEPAPQDSQPKKTQGEGGKIRGAPERLPSAHNLRVLGLALHSHESTYGAFPSPGVPKGVVADKNITSPHSWRVAILPFMEQENLWKLIPEKGRGAIPKEVSDTIIKAYQSPIAKDVKPQTNYRVFVGNGAAFEWGKALKVRDFTDGMSNTIMAVECADPIPWTSIEEFQYDPKKPLPKLGGIFPGGFHALMGDGQAMWIPDTTPEATIRAMITRNGGEVYALPNEKKK
jgi:Protein of unknown function (DUF1559)